MPQDISAESLVNRRIRNIGRTMTPAEQKSRAPIGPAEAVVVATSRVMLENIIGGRRGSRFLVIVGPCSIHSVEEAFEYATRLNHLAIKYQDRLFIMMRTYFEKPRTTIGWKGLLTEPHLDGRFDVDTGRHLARQLLIKLAALGLPAATEFLDPHTPQFLDDLVSWAAIGARTVESQTHREMAAGLSMPVGFKNGTSGSIEIAVNAMLTARNPHAFVGMDQGGREALFEAEGNPYGHLILRGGSGGPNYAHEYVLQAQELLRAKELPQRILIDCSHANAEGNFQRQHEVVKTVLTERKRSSSAVFGLMLESYLLAGKQHPYTKPLQHGRSVTDACIGWEETEDILGLIHSLCV